MPTVADALRQHGDDDLKQFGDRLPTVHKRVLSVIRRCRTGELGHLQYACDGCQQTHWVGRSCGNRHCPNCQSDKTQIGLNERLHELLPVPYFMVTFTVPEALRKIVRAHQEVCYRALFDGGSQPIRQLASGKPFVGTDRLGYFGVLHTWGRNPLVYHPHLHFVVPGGGIRLDEHGQPEKWCSTSEDFLMHHGTLIRAFRAKLRDKLAASGVTHDVPRRELSAAWKKKSVVDVKPVGDGQAVLKYLAPYVHRVAISDKRIVKVDDTHVTFSMTPSGRKQRITKTVTGKEFVRGFVQHVLPTGFHKIRYYGWQHPRRKLDVEEIRWLACVALGRFFLPRFASVEQPDDLPPLACFHWPAFTGLLSLRRRTETGGRDVYEQRAAGDSQPAVSGQWMMTATTLQPSNIFERLHLSERRRCARTMGNRVMKAIGAADLRLAARLKLCRRSRRVDAAEWNPPMSDRPMPDCIRPTLSADQRVDTSPMQNPYSLFCSQRAVPVVSGPLEQRLVSFG